MHRLVILLLALFLLPSCQSVRKLVKASPADRSEFLDHRDEMTRMPADAAFQFLWRSPQRRVHDRARPLTKLYIAPVRLDFLRPQRQGFTKWGREASGPLSPEGPRMAERIRQEFIAAFQRSESPRYTVVPAPARDALTLEIALVELNPTEVTRNVGKFGAKLLLGPVGTVAGLAVHSSGNIAIEGKIVLPRDREPVFAFADNESDKLTLYCLRDFAPYGHATIAVKEWASAFEELTHSRAGTPIGDASILTLMPF